MAAVKCFLLLHHSADYIFICFGIIWVYSGFFEDRIPLKTMAEGVVVRGAAGGGGERERMGQGSVGSVYRPGNYIAVYEETI